MAKGYAQKIGISYIEVFAPIARLNIVRILVAMAAQREWEVFQTDVKSAFLHGELQEKVCFQQLLASSRKGEKTMYTNLRKLYMGLNRLHEPGAVR